MVAARQRPETANGIVFMLLEDERGTVNLIVPPPVYERCRAAVRTAPLLSAKGKLERQEGTDQCPSHHRHRTPPRKTPPTGRYVKSYATYRPVGPGAAAGGGGVAGRGAGGASALGGGAEPAELSLSLRCCARCRQVPKARRARQ